MQNLEPKQATLISKLEALQKSNGDSLVLVNEIKNIFYADIPLLFWAAKELELFARSPIAQDEFILKMADFKGLTVAHTIAKYHANAWMHTEAALDIQNLTFRSRINDSGFTVAHELANHELWLETPAAKNMSILKSASTAGWTVAHRLAELHPKWVYSEEAKNPDILKLTSNKGESVAHKLACFQPQWIFTESAKNYEILKIADHTGKSVAHMLAKNQPEWLKSKAAQDYEILKIADKDNWTVAHSLACFQDLWVTSTAANDIEILKLTTDDGTSVAETLVNYTSDCLTIPALTNKSVLTIGHDLSKRKEIVANLIVNRYCNSHGLTHHEMAMILIRQGAAYRCNKTLESSVGEMIYSDAKILIDDCQDSSVAFMHAQALYSTMHHCLFVAKHNEQAEDIQSIDNSQWEALLAKAEIELTWLLDCEPDIIDNASGHGILCEPAEIYIKKLLAARHLNCIDAGDLASLEIDISEQTRHLY